MTNDNGLFTTELQNKIDLLKRRRKKINLGAIDFASPLILAPMSSICTAPFRLLMEDLGAGGTVSELISCHGINYKNAKTLEMLKIDPREKNVGLQLFGENADKMSEAAKVAADFGPRFIDINMGCPVKKVVGTGAGSSLMKNPENLPHFFKTIKQSIQLPLTIKIRLGWDQAQLNAGEIIHIAKEEGIEFVAVHGRTRAQQYTGHADWNQLHKLKSESPLPLIGNGDLNTESMIREKMSPLSFDALMLGRGPLRNPFLFLTPYIQTDEKIEFTGVDHYEILLKLVDYSTRYARNERILLVSVRKHLIWMAAGFHQVASFREQVYKTNDLTETLKLAKTFFTSQELPKKGLTDHLDFMAGGHG